ncbi:MAG: hypothetical protein ACTHLK_00595 [Brucella intermedia]
MTERKPGIRIDGGNRRDLNKDRVAGRMTALAKDAPTPEQTVARRKAMEKRATVERKAAQIGHDGAKTSKVRVRDPQGQRARTLILTIRCKPGSFEWRYGRDKQDALFHAGNHLAILWERAGMTVASSANFLRGIASGYSTGLAEGRAQAIDKLDGFRDTMGQKPAERLIDYCVLGLTTAEIARKDGAKERDMAPVLHQHLRDCARHFHFMGKKR